MLTPRQSTKFKRDIKRLQKSGKDLAKIEKIIQLLAQQKPLDAHRRDHLLVGNWHGFRECHIEPNWLLIYRVRGNELELARSGSHAELF